MNREEIVTKLISLGTTKEEIAKELLARNIKGNRVSWKYCPIANYMKGEDFKIGIGVASEFFEYDISAPIGIRVTIIPTIGWERSNFEELYFSLADYPKLKPIKDFIHAFDDGEFEELMK